MTQDAKPNDRDGLFTPEELALFKASRALRKRSEQLVYRSQVASRPPGYPRFRSRPLATEPEPSPSEADTSAANDRREDQ